MTDSATLNASELVHAHDQLPALTNDDVLAFQLRQVLGDSGSRSPDEIGNILVAEQSSEARRATSPKIICGHLKSASASVPATDLSSETESRERALSRVSVSKMECYPEPKMRGLSEV